VRASEAENRASCPEYRKYPGQVFLCLCAGKCPRGGNAHTQENARLQKNMRVREIVTCRIIPARGKYLHTGKYPHAGKTAAPAQKERRHSSPQQIDLSINRGGTQYVETGR